MFAELQTNTSKHDGFKVPDFDRHWRALSQLEPKPDFEPHRAALSHLESQWQCESELKKARDEFALQELRCMEKKSTPIQGKAKYFLKRLLPELLDKSAGKEATSKTFRHAVVSKDTSQRKIKDDRGCVEDFSDESLLPQITDVAFLNRIKNGSDEAAVKRKASWGAGVRSFKSRYLCRRQRTKSMEHCAEIDPMEPFEAELEGEILFLAFCLIT